MQSLHSPHLSFPAHLPTCPSFLHQLHPINISPVLLSCGTGLIDRQTCFFTSCLCLWASDPCFLLPGTWNLLPESVSDLYLPATCKLSNLELTSKSVNSSQSAWSVCIWVLLPLLPKFTGHDRSSCFLRGFGDELDHTGVRGELALVQIFKLSQFFSKFYQQL